MDPTPPPGSEALSIRLGALEERVRLLESSARPVPQPAVTAEPGDPHAARSARGVIAARLAALGHPSRLELLAAVVRGATSTTELSAGLGTGSTGQLYHHLNQLVAAGWLQTTGRGRYEIPAERREALATVLASVDPAAAGSAVTRAR